MWRTDICIAESRRGAGHPYPKPDHESDPPPQCVRGNGRADIQCHQGSSGLRKRTGEIELMSIGVDLPAIIHTQKESGCNEMTMNIACIGLGRMGSGIAPNIQRAGFGFIVYNRTPEKMSPFIECGEQRRQK